MFAWIRDRRTAELGNDCPILELPVNCRCNRGSLFRRNRAHELAHLPVAKALRINKAHPEPFASIRKKLRILVVEISAKLPGEPAESITFDLDSELPRRWLVA